MKNGVARALAIIALVFMVLFLAALVTTIIDHTLLNGSVGYIALCTGMVVFILFLALKIDGRGFSITKMNNEIEMKKIEDELAKQQEAEQAEQTEKSEKSESGETAAAEQSEKATADTESADEKANGENTKKPNKNNKKKK